MNSFGIAKIVGDVGRLADKLITSEEERLKFRLEMQKVEASLLKEQAEINVTEAKHSSVFVAGWRPFIGWIGGLALAYQFLLYPILLWIWTLGQVQGWIPCYIDPTQVSGKCTFDTPPVFESGPLFAIITGMLGVSGMRSFDKLKKTDTKVVKG